MDKFFKWFDYQSWYPLGRPVGTTIYPGMQISAVCIWRTLGWLAATLDMPNLAMSLNDTCAYIPAWFGVAASLLLGLFAWEVSGKPNAGTQHSFFGALVPIHSVPHLIIPARCHRCRHNGRDPCAHYAFYWWWL